MGLQFKLENNIASDTGVEREKEHFPAAQGGHFTCG